MAEELHFKRNRSRPSPMKARRLSAVHAGAAAVGATSSADFPGLDLDPAEGGRRRFVSGGVSLLGHGAFILLLLLTAYLAPEEIIEELIEIQRINEPSKSEPAPRPRVVAERSASTYKPAPMAVQPQVANPAVIQKPAAVVQAPTFDVQAVNTQIPKQVVANAAPQIAQARAYQSPVQVAADPVRIEAGTAALRGPIEANAPVAIGAGPRQVAAAGSTVGTAGAEALGTGSSVREGAVTGRDVLGAKTGRRASVNTQVGNSNMSGRGGAGTGPGTGLTYEDCLARGEVVQYMGRVRSRVLSRWALPPGVDANQRVELRFRLDPAGTASSVSFTEAPDPRLGQSAVDAVRSASPFDPMPDSVRCLSERPLIATFRNPLGTANN